MIDFKKFEFAPVIKLPKDYEIYDFTINYDPERLLKSPYGVGKYAEKRAHGMYTGKLYDSDSEDKRNIHMGVDIGAPVGTSVHMPYDGQVYMFAYNDKPLDYGYTLITEHQFEGLALYILYGHLSKDSVDDKYVGQKLNKGEVIARVGDKHENGGWNSHLHFQLSYEKPTVCDMPGVVNEKDLPEALKKYPDPRLILGSLY